jgi:hypothetical protein
VSVTSAPFESLPDRRSALCSEVCLGLPSFHSRTAPALVARSNDWGASSRMPSALVRFAIEFLRVNERVLGALSVAHVASIGVMVIGGALLLDNCRRTLQGELRRANTTRSGSGDRCVFSNVRSAIHSAHKDDDVVRERSAISPDGRT